MMEASYKIIKEAVVIWYSKISNIRHASIARGAIVKFVSTPPAIFWISSFFGFCTSRCLRPCTKVGRTLWASIRRSHHRATVGAFQSRFYPLVFLLHLLPATPFKSVFTRGSNSEPWVKPSSLICSIDSV